jgi:uncharacterized membrane protein YgdD (TMEM256/DUF423 family)
MKNMQSKTMLMLGASLVFFGIILGAFGAHGLKAVLDESKMNTFKTGVDYQLYHGFGLLILGIVSLLRPEIKLNLPAKFMLAGVILFSMNCYLYALSGVKFFAMIVPFGGVSFIIAWGLFFVGLKNIRE